MTTTKPEFTWPVLSDEQKSVKDRADSLRAEIANKQRDLRDVMNTCQHVWVPAGFPRQGNPYEKWGGEWSISASAKCAICDRDGGAWYCEHSPTHLCEYNTKEDPCCDFCIHCGNPDERK